MARRLFNLLTLLSLLCFVCLVALWAGQHRRFKPKDHIPAQRSNAILDIPAWVHLDRVQPYVNINNVSLDDALGFMRDISGANVDVNWKAIEAAGINKSTTISVQFGGLTFGGALARVVDAAGLAYTTDGSVVSVSTRKDLRRIGTSYRPQWPWPSDEDLQLQRAWYDYPSAISLAWPLTFGEACEIAGREFEAQPDVQWEALKAIGLRREASIDVRYGHVKEWFEAVLRYVSVNHDIQYQVRNGRLLVAPKERFDREERSAKRIALAIVAGSLLVSLVILLRVRRRPGRLRLYVAGSVAVLSCLMAIGVWKTRSTSLECTLLDRRIAIGEYSPGWFIFSIKPVFLPLAPLRDGQPVSIRPASFSWHGVRLERGGPLSSEVSVVAPCAAFAGLFLVLPLLWLTLTTRRLMRYSHRLRTGRCTVCGYDLRASGDRCPECGRAA